MLCHPTNYQLPNRYGMVSRKIITIGHDMVTVKRYGTVPVRGVQYVGYPTCQYGTVPK
jgi:hypothetical protein